MDRWGPADAASAGSVAVTCDRMCFMIVSVTP